jgi:branched-chain amino acid transport system permease protein
MPVIDIAFWEPITVLAIVNTILALALYVTLMSGQLSAAHAALMGVGAYAAGVLTVNFDIPYWPALIGGAAAGAIFGTAIAIPTTHMRVFVQSLATLAFGQALSIIAFNVDYLGGAQSFTGMHPYTTVATALVALAVALFVAFQFDRSRMGLAARAVRDSELAASAMGISVFKMRVVTFCLGGALAGLAGGVSAHYTLVVSPVELAFFPSFSILVFVLVGGSYTPFGAILGAVVLTIIPQIFRFADTLRFALYGLAIVAVVLARPEGLLPRLRRASFRRTAEAPMVESEDAT